MEEERPMAIVIPFGTKHKGKDLSEVMETDPGYIDYIKLQPWLRERYPTIYDFIVRGGGGDPTPAHNALQARFLDDIFCMRVARACDPKFDGCSISKRTFEDAFDVSFLASTERNNVTFYIEVKPS